MAKAWHRRGKGRTRKEVESIIKGVLGLTVSVRDGKYKMRCLSVEDFQELIKEYRRRDPEYRQEVFDCDDSGDTFLGDMKRAWADCSKGKQALCFGWVRVRTAQGGHHWMNWMIDNRGFFYLIEPQTNTIINKPIPETIKYAYEVGQ